MSNVIEISHLSSTPCGNLRGPQPLCPRRPNTDYSRLLLEMRLRPEPERAFLRKLLMRAAANGVLCDFPVAAPVVLTS
jgi:hypothetical protein